ncbi:MAG: acylphosphatase [Rhodospirillales bacterium]|nr:acylphosphatase [Rhodospirillales bacterium]
MAVKTVRIVIEGRVQGVWFRGWTVQQAERLGIRGWVCNRRDGNVEALFSGPAGAVDEMINACRSGPPMANVTSITEHPAEPPGEDGFHVTKSGGLEF